jgi:diaminopimelate decarboxylase
MEATVTTQADKARRLAGQLGGVADGAFAPSGIPIEELAARFGTPFYLYDATVVVDQVRRVREALGTDVLYSVKANPSLAICQLIAAEPGLGAEVASAGELAVALAAGFDPGSIVFAGPGKTDDELARLVEAGILADHVESLAEIDRLAAVAGRVAPDRPVGVALRLNPTAQLLGAQMRMGGTASQFGIDEADLDAAVGRVARYSQLSLRGIHVYTATQVFDAAALVEHCRNVLELALATADRLGRPLEEVDLGGGFGIPYFEKDVPLDLEAVGQGVRSLLATYRSDPRLAGCRGLCELGRYLVADAGIYVTRIVDAKVTRGRSFVITDGGMSHHLTATGTMGQVFRKAFPLINLSRMDVEAADAASRPTRRVTVAGPLCTPLDTFGTDVELVDPHVGDLIGVCSSGAYGYSASNLGFLSHPAPAEVLLQRGQAILLRPAGTPDDVLRGQARLPASGA